MGFRFRSNDERSYFLAHFGVTANTNIRARCVLVAVVAVDSKKFVGPAMKFNLDFKSDFLDTFPISPKRRFRDEKLFSSIARSISTEYASILLNTDIV